MLCLFYVAVDLPAAGTVILRAACCDEPGEIFQMITQEQADLVGETACFCTAHPPVSYTHLDVYKRQGIY